MKIAIPILLTVVYTAALLFSRRILQKNWTASIGKLICEWTSQLSDNTPSNHRSFFVDDLHFKQGKLLSYFSFGQISIPGDELKFFGIKQGDSWLKTGLSLCLVITGVTAIFMYFQLKKVDVDWSILQGGIFWILLFSLTNSFGEEMIYRIGLISPLDGLLAPTKIFLLSAIIFGLAHINGMPSGIIGISLAGILGFVLAKSIFETQGFFWAWLIHFLQDVVIIGSLYLMNKTT
jgi:membrane protease YdiL (CAAX protease family)